MGDQNSRVMTYEDIEFVIRAGLGRNEWILLIYYPDNGRGEPLRFRVQRIARRRKCLSAPTN